MLRQFGRNPAWVLSCHLNDQFYNLVLDWRPARIRALSGTIELFGDELAIPSKYGVRLGDAGDLFQTFAAQPLANFGERESLRIYNRSRVGRCVRRMRFSAATYSFCSSNCWFTSPVT